MYKTGTYITGTGLLIAMVVGLRGKSGREQQIEEANGDRARREHRRTTIGSEELWKKERGCSGKLGRKGKVSETVV